MGELRPHSGSSPYFPTGQAITWHYHEVTETARVIRDNASGLVVWKPSGSMSLVKRGADGVGARDIPLAERFSRSWQMIEQSWKGPGVVREAPTGVPWSIWWFWSDSGVFEGAYLNLELPHARPRALDGRGGDVPVELARTHSRDLALDLWIEPGPDGAHELWLKDGDELDASVDQGRMSGRERVAVLSVGEHASRRLFDHGVEELLARWSSWQAPVLGNDRMPLPDTELIRALRTTIG